MKRARSLPSCAAKASAPSSRLDRRRPLGDPVRIREGSMSTTFDLAEVKRRMDGALGALKHELGGLRTGRASASLLDPIQVDAYGSHMPIVQVATVSVPEPRLISVQVWDRGMVGAVEKAIRD